MQHHMAKIAITIDADLLHRLDALVEKKHFKNRSQAVQQIVQDRIEKIEHKRLFIECAKLDIAAEQLLAEEGLEKDFDEWADY